MDEKSGGPKLVVAEVNLGVLYVTGAKFAPDKTLAIELFRRAALQGDAGAANCLGYSLQSGDGVERDLVEAYKWLSLALARNASEETKQRATLNIERLLPLMTPSEIEEGKKRAAQFVPVK